MWQGQVNILFLTPSFRQYIFFPMISFRWNTTSPSPSLILECLTHSPFFLVVSFPWVFSVYVAECSPLPLHPSQSPVQGDDPPLDASESLQKWLCPQIRLVHNLIMLRSYSMPCSIPLTNSVLCFQDLKTLTLRSRLCSVFREWPAFIGLVGSQSKHRRSGSLLWEYSVHRRAFQIRSVSQVSIGRSHMTIVNCFPESHRYWIVESAVCLNDSFSWYPRRGSFET